MYASGELQALNSIEVRSELEDDAIIEWLIDEGEQVIEKNVTFFE